MQFTKLRLVGFKSFVEPMELVIERGLTGVVGPNGCGKSNLVEALRWVMGENSYKNMRASGMDEVIFSGSNTRPARNSAEVMLYLDNGDRSAPAAFNDADELQVSRRIERDAGSVYRINGKDVRARDVQLLFADQSTGARSPSMVGQGRVGELIAAKPQARRALLEEAAGISGLHSRRHEAELRLRAAGSNLDRLEDIVSDLAGRIESLKRQARHANRFRALSADIRKAEAGLFYLRWVQAKTQEAEAESRLSAATKAVGEKADAQMKAARVQTAGREGLPALREEAVKAQAAHQRLGLAARALEEEQGRIHARRAELVRRLEQLVHDIAREEALCRENADSVKRLEAEEAELQREDGADAGRETAFAEELQQLEAQQAVCEDTLAGLLTKRAECNADHAQLQQLIADAGERQDKLKAEVAAAEAALAALAQEIAAIAGMEELGAQLARQEQALAAAESEVATAEKTVVQARGLEAERRQYADKTRDALRGYETEARTLQQMLAAFAGDGHIAVVEAITVDKGFEVALGAALGDDLEASLEEDAPVYWQGKGEGEDSGPALPMGAIPLGQVVQAPVALQRRLAQIGVIETAQATVLQPQLAVGQRLVSREGAVWRWDGLVARADAPTAAAQRLAQKNRLAELKALLERAAQQAMRAQAEMVQAQAAVRQAAEEERAAREQVRRIREELDDKRGRLAAMERSLGERLSRHDAWEENCRRLQRDYEENTARLAEMQVRRRALPPVDALEQDIAASGGQLAEVRAAVTEARAAQAAWRHAMQSRRQRLAIIGDERKNWQARAGNAEQQLNALRARHAEAEAETKHLAETPDDFEAQKKALFDKIAQAETEAQAVADRLAQAEQGQSELDRAAAEAIQALSAAREQRARVEERLSAAMDRRADIETRIMETLACPPHETMKLAGFAVDGRLPAEDVLEQNLERLRLERERLGPVNLRAEEESTEIAERYEAIVAERDDIVEAIKKLRFAIQNLNREGRERLLEAFERVNSAFQRLFTRLFGGGTAELQLIESDDPLETGLEILARPPGKKPQTMTLLSGGEQALTALALIFAVFLTNPAPVCVLDEVDAPLDDYNVERYCNLMDEMTSLTQTRFIIITHNPITMARMNRLFGVTMGEQGVSQLVSVDLQTAEQLRETD